jgi:hypothetical protein
MLCMTWHSARLHVEHTTHRALCRRRSRQHPLRGSHWMFQKLGRPHTCHERHLRVRADVKMLTAQCFSRRRALRYVALDCICQPRPLQQRTCTSAPNKMASEGMWKASRKLSPSVLHS